MPAIAQSDPVFKNMEAHLAVTAARIEPVFMHGRPSVQFALDGPSTEAFAGLTGEMIGQTQTVSLCGHDLIDVVEGTADCPSLAAHFHE